MNRSALVCLGMGILAGCLSVDEGTEAGKVVVRETQPESGVKVIDMSMEVRYYPVPMPIVSRLWGESCEFKQVKVEKTSEVVAKETSEDRAWKDLLARFDVLWPEGSSLAYLRDNGLLRVRNTAENHEHIEQALRLLTEPQEQFEVGVEFLSVEQKTLDAIGRELVKGKPDNARYVLSDFDVVPAAKFHDCLVGNREVKIISSAKALTGNGENVVVKDIVECIYPQDYGVSLGEMTSGSSNETRQVRQAGLAAVEPQNFTLREVGTILDVTPTLVTGGSGNGIELWLKPQHVGEPEWKDYGMRLPAPNGGMYELQMKQPHFQCRSVDTKIRIGLGGCALVGASRVAPKAGNEGPLCLVFVRVRLAGDASKE